MWVILHVGLTCLIISSHNLSMQVSTCHIRGPDLKSDFGCPVHVLKALLQQLSAARQLHAVQGAKDVVQAGRGALAPQPQQLVLPLGGVKARLQLHPIHLLLGQREQAQELFPPAQGHLSDDGVQDDGRPRLGLLIWKQTGIDVSQSKLAVFPSHAITTL